MGDSCGEWRVLEGDRDDLEAVDYLIFRRGRWDGAVCMPELDRVGDDLALGVAFDQLESPVRVQSRANVEAFLGTEVPCATGGRFGVNEDRTTHWA